MNPDTPALSDVPFNGALCWEITGGKGTSYVFGSIHQMDSTKISLPLAHLEQLLHHTRALCVEVDLSALPEQTPTPIHEGNADHDLTQLLGAADHERLTEILADSTGLPPLPTVPLPLLTLLVTMNTQLSSVLFESADFEVESHFTAAAIRHGLPIHQLESFEEQMSLLTLDTPLVEQVEELHRAIEVHDDPATPDMFVRYAAQDLRLLPEAEFRADVMIDRNRRMAERLELLLRDRSVFAIVGAAHLPYDSGILARLAARGFAVHPHPLEITTT